MGRLLTPWMVVCGLAAGAAVLEAAPASNGSKQKTQVVTAGPQYEAGPLWCLFFGKDYRDLWTQPIQAPVLDLARFAGGLTAKEETGRKQTRGLKFEGRNGREYKFRSIDKDPSEALPEELRGEALKYLARDQTSSGFPAADLAVEPLLHAAGVLHSHSRLVVLPDSPQLGKFRKDFAGMLGMIEDDPEKDEPEETPGFEKITRIIETEELYELLRKSPSERVDARAYLRARLVDLYLGDWDRHYKQWEWGKASDGLWKPIPKDRDMAFSRYDGLLVRMGGTGGTTLGLFGERYQGLVGFNWAAREMDRRLLAPLDEKAWQEESAGLAQRLTDEVIDGAARRLPPEYYEKHGEWLARTLKVRRDRLPEAADDWYRLLADKVDIFATEDGERLHVSRTADGAQVILLAKNGTTHATFERQFKANETSEVRVYLQGGDDTAVVQGSGPVKVRVIGGEGADVLDDSAGGATRFYDSQGENAVLYGPGTQVSTHAYDEPESPKEERPRDWGGTMKKALWLSAGSDIGFFTGLGFVRTDYGFRRAPYASRHRVRVGYASGASKFRGEYHADFRRPESTTSFEIFARASGIEIVRFYGFGNETVAEQDDIFFKADQSQYTFQPTIGMDVGRGFRLRVGPKVRYSELRWTEGRYIGVVRPYGFEGFGEAGAAASLELDTRDNPGAPRKGLRLYGGGSVYPEVWDVQSTFGEVHGEASGAVTVSPLLETTLAARLGGKRVFGTYPFHEAAFIGGSSRAPQVRGLRGQRYAGDAAVYANAELRIKLFDMSLLVPTDVGVFGLADAGRVWLKSEESNRWHKAVGGGLWLAPVRRSHTLTFAAAQSEGRRAFYFSAGFLF